MKNKENKIKQTKKKLLGTDPKCFLVKAKEIKSQINEKK